MAFSLRHGGFSLIEILTAIVILSIIAYATAIAFNLVVSNVRRSESLNSAQSAVDNDISKIRYMAKIYTPCEDPLGEVPASFPKCGAASPSDLPANYYFPPVDSSGAADLFSDYCSSADLSSHFTSRLIAAINALPDPSTAVSRNTAIRQNPSDPQNHNIVISYSSADTVAQRSFIVAPVARGFCP